MSLFLKPQPEADERFFYVLDKSGNRVGRIFRDLPPNITKEDGYWFWGLEHPYERGSNEPHYGHARSLDLAKAAFKRRWLLSHPE